MRTMKKYGCLGFVLLLLVFGVATIVEAQDSTTVIPPAVLQAVTDKGMAQAQLPENVRAAVLGKGGQSEKYVTQVSQKPAGYACRNARGIDGTKQIPVEGIGLVTAYSVSIDRTVDAYWQEYRRAAGAKITAWAKYVTAVSSLNPHIADVAKICKGYTIRLPYAGSVVSTAVVDQRNGEILSLRERLAQLESQLANQARLLEQSNAKVAYNAALAVERTKLQESIQQKDKELAKKDRSMEEFGVVLAQADHRFAELKSKMAAQTLVLEQSEEKVAELEVVANEVPELKEQIRKQNDQILDRNDRISDQDDQISQGSETIQKLEDALALANGKLQLLSYGIVALLVVLMLVVIVMFVIMMKHVRKTRTSIAAAKSRVTP